MLNATHKNADIAGKMFNPVADHPDTINTLSEKTKISG